MAEIGRMCCTCSSFKLWEEFNKNPNGKNGHHSRCRTCSKSQAKERYKTSDKFTYITRLYRLTKEEFLLKYENQNKQCLICKDEIYLFQNNGDKQLVVDHCHTTGKIRGLLCNHCNRGLGMFKDNPIHLLNAAKYLGENGL